MKKGEFYINLIKGRDDSLELQTVMEKTVLGLLKKETSSEKPGMLLGKIQSGKTRAFIGIIALSFDNDYDMAIVLTKGTKALAKQTYERLKHNFRELVVNDKVKICDIMHLPQNFTQFELQQKLIVVVKKQADNLRRVMQAIESTYPDLKSKKLLIIDDEADYASIGFRADRQSGNVSMNRIASQIDELRRKVSKYDYLQVTATPYSLYLQPENLEIKNQDILFKPTRPAFTELLPIYPGYVGGEYYFEKSQNPESAASCVYEEIPIEELEILKGEDRRSFRIEDVLISPKVKFLRKAIMNFIVGSCIRRNEQSKLNERQQKYSFIVHTEHSRSSHAWQEKIVLKMKDVLRKSFLDNKELLDNLIRESYDDISKSIKLANEELPLFEKAKESVYEALEKDYLMITKVNSESDEEQLLDENGQLYLRTPMNIFIGGQILDRGLTIDNLVGFYYGRRPQRMQQDTVLQHSRMYGNRLKGDLAITRFYTARRIYEVMEKIHEFDSALREAFEKGAHDAGIVFIHKDAKGSIVPCSPNKILLSAVTTLKPYKRLLPTGFQTKRQIYLRENIRNIDNTINRLASDSKEPFLIEFKEAEKIIDDIHKTFEFEDGLEWDVISFKASLEYLSKNSDNFQHRGKLWCLIRKNRNLSRKKKDKSFSDAPDTPQDEGGVAKEVAIDIPMLILIRQNGEEELGWRGHPFWWPVLVAPRNTKTVIFSSELLDVTPDSYVVSISGG